MELEQGLCGAMRRGGVGWGGVLIFVEGPNNLYTPTYLVGLGNFVTPGLFAGLLFDFLLN